MRAFPCCLSLALTACAATTSPEPSLGRRAGEAIDPRLPLAAEAPLGPVDPALAARLAELVAEGRDGGRKFDAAEGPARALANAAGAKESESWIAAQQSLSGLEAARAQSVRALADVDALTAARITATGGIARADLAAVEAASGELRAMTDAQSQVIDAIGARLAR
jgi:hypothetical protein